ncbi:hypothetical protein VNO77_25478 [Canavalia gladiata]|uniref:Uncharacterized protein n=1 Tax=Canavalia gladiata TaxID=3824 RepID=A0AAN9LBL8_CANGL
MGDHSGNCTLERTEQVWNCERGILWRNAWKKQSINLDKKKGKHECLPQNHQEQGVSPSVLVSSSIGSTNASY